MNLLGALLGKLLDLLCTFLYSSDSGLSRLRDRQYSHDGTHTEPTKNQCSFFHHTFPNDFAAARMMARASRSVSAIKIMFFVIAEAKSSSW